MILLLTSLASAADGETVDKDWSVDVKGDLKSFFTATLPYEHVLMPPTQPGKGSSTPG